MASKKSEVLVLTYTPFEKEPRALKQVHFLREKYAVVTAGFGRAPFVGVRHFEIPEGPTYQFGILGRLLGVGLLFLHWYRPLRFLNALDKKTLELIGHQSWDVIIAHDLKTLDVALRMEPTCGVILDLHEYAPRQEEHSLVWKILVAPYFRWMCRQLVPRAREVVTVSEGIVEEYERKFGIKSTLIVNATPYYELAPTRVNSPLRLVHSGGIAVQRRLDLMIEGVRRSKADVTLDLYLVGDESPLLDSLKGLAGDDARIKFKKPVPYEQLVPTLNDYDLGLSIFPPTTFNLAWCLPNKFFDFVQARLGVIVGPSPEMIRYVEKFKIGAVLPDFDPQSLAEMLDTLTPSQVEKWKESSNANAMALSSDLQSVVWDEIMNRVLANGGTRGKELD